MGTEARGLDGKKAPPTPPALPLARARSRTTRVVVPDDGTAASTPSLRTPVTVPFLWEDAPGRPKPHGATEASSTVPAAAATDGGAPNERHAKARVMPLKLPPRLQVPSSSDGSLSPKTVLRGPYYGCTGGARRPLGLGRAASFRRIPSAGGGGGLFSRRKADKTGGRELDASCCSPSRSSSSSSSSASFCGDDRGHGARRRPVDGRADPEEDESAQGSVRITRFTRNRSLPSMTTSHLWASIRKSVKQMAPWS